MIIDRNITKALKTFGSERGKMAEISEKTGIPAINLSRWKESRPGQTISEEYYKVLYPEIESLLPDDPRYYPRDKLIDCLDRMTASALDVDKLIKLSRLEYSWESNLNETELLLIRQFRAVGPAHRAHVLRVLHSIDDYTKGDIENACDGCESTLEGAIVSIMSALRSLQNLKQRSG